MSKGLKFWLYTCIAGVIAGFSLLFAAVSANAAADNTVPPANNTSTVSVAPAATDPVSTYLAPGGILTISIGGIFMILREVNSLRSLEVQKYKDRAITAESQATQDTQRLSEQVSRLESKLDQALLDVEAKHDLWLEEVAHRRKLEILLAEHGVALPIEVKVVPQQAV